LRLVKTCMEREVVTTTADTKGDYRPLVFLLTDGQPTDRWEEAAETIRNMRRPRAANVYAIGCGPDVDFDVLRRITDVVLMMPGVTPESFRKFFVWLTASVQSASIGVGQESAEGPVGLDSLPLGILEQAPHTKKSPEAQPRQVFMHALCRKTRKPYLMRFSRRSEDGRYVAVASHALQELESGDSDLLSAVDSSQLVGCPPCPYCGNRQAIVCSCRAIFCDTEETNEQVVCPRCNASLTMREGGSFQISRSEG
jgi:hypothetical protein